MSREEIRPGDRVNAVKIWREGSELKHWDHSMQGTVESVNESVRYGVLVRFNKAMAIAFERVEVWLATDEKG